MTTSGTVSFNLTVAQIINKTFSKMGVKIAEQDIQADEFQDGLDSLNMMIKSWAAQGLHLWSKDEGILFLDAGKTDFNLGPSGDEACQFDDFISTTCRLGEIALSTTIAVNSTVGMADLDNIGIQLDDNTRHWTTIVSFTATSITIATGIPSSSAIGNSIFTFTNLVERPNRILSYRRKTFADDNEIPVITWSRDEYFNQVNKNSQGTVVNCYYSPQLTDGRLYVWQTASSVNDLLRFTFERQLQDVTIGTETIDFPPEWLEAVIYNLAARLSDDYSVPIAKQQFIEQKAEQFLDDLLGWDEEMTSLNLQPDFN